MDSGDGQNNRNKENVVYPHNGILFSHKKGNEVLLQCGWTLKTMLSERINIQKVTYSIISFIEMFRIVKSMETECRLLVSPLGNGRGRGYWKVWGFFLGRWKCSGSSGNGYIQYSEYTENYWVIHLKTGKMNFMSCPFDCNFLEGMNQRWVTPWSEVKVKLQVSSLGN